MAARLLIFDEAHHVIADNKWGRLYEALGMPPTLGVTATPVRGDGKGLGEHAGGIFKTMVIGPLVSELVKRGVLVAPVVYTSFETPDLDGLKANKDGDYNNKALAERVDKPVITGSALEQYKKVCPGAKAIIYCVNVEHAKHVVAEFNKGGFKFALLVGEPHMSDAERTAADRKLRSGELDGVCTVDLISEGYDLPDIQCIIMLRPTASESLFIQQAWRGGRSAEGKEVWYLLDHVGNVGKVVDGEFIRKHGLPTEDRDWSLDGRAKKKGKRKQTIEDIKVAVAQCKACYACFDPAPVCPHCGTPVEVKSRNVAHVDGELHEITREMADAMRKGRRQEVGKAQTLEELQKIAKERNYSPGWAYHTYQAKKRKTSGKPTRPTEPSLDELKGMTLLELQNVASQQAWPDAWAIQFYNQNHNQ